jgi:hypothetical protein
MEEVRPLTVDRPFQLVNSGRSIREPVPSAYILTLLSLIDASFGRLIRLLPPE